MKIRLAIASCCIMFSVIISCLVFAYVQNVCKTLIVRAEALQQSAENTEGFFEEAQAFCDSWKSHSALFCAVVHHKDADDLRQRFLQLQKSVQNKDFKSVLTEMEACRIFLQVIAEGEKPNLSNIL